VRAARVLTEEYSPEMRSQAHLRSHCSIIYRMSNELAVLSCWKDIACYLGKGVRTVQRWERELGLPVRRPSGSDKHVVIAMPSELKQWMRSRLSPRSPTVSPEQQNEHVAKLHLLLDCTKQRTKQLHQRAAEETSRAEKMVRSCTERQR
jgi:hypothetical protein